jgi:hypothetical protein
LAAISQNTAEILLLIAAEIWNSVNVLECKRREKSVMPGMVKESLSAS